jgi:hypothetical protein
MWEVKKEVLLRVNEQRNILHELRKRKANWIGHILRRNCLLKQVIEGKIKGEIEVIRRRERRRQKLLNDLKDRRGYYHLKEEALDRTTWRNRFGRGAGPVVRQNTEGTNEYEYKPGPEKQTGLSPILSYLRQYIIFLRPICDLTVLWILGPATLGQCFDLQPPASERPWNSKKKHMLSQIWLKKDIFLLLRFRNLTLSKIYCIKI